MALEFYSEADLEGGAFARVLLTGDRKAGKTTAVLTTAPGPIAVLNADGPGAPMAARRFGAKGLKILDVTGPELWIKGCEAAANLAKAGEIKTIVADTITLLVNKVIAGEMGRRFKDYHIWSNTYQCFMNGLEILERAQAHVFLIAHYDMDNGLITLDGKLKKDIPAMAHDIVHLDYKPGRTTRDPETGTITKLERAFMIGPSASGLSGGRHSDENKIIPADVRLLLAELGISE